MIKGNITAKHILAHPLMLIGALEGVKETV